MTCDALMDNDVILKVCIYGLHEMTLRELSDSGYSPATINVARYSLRKIAKKTKQVLDRENTSRALENFLNKFSFLEPLEEEINLAANLEQIALSNNFELDTGESQLISLLITRNMNLMLTGDKRAIRAAYEMEILAAEGRVACFEQFISWLLERVVDHRCVRDGVCAERLADKAVTACFACWSSNPERDDILLGLASYINHLRSQTGRILIDDLGSVIS